MSYLSPQGRDLAIWMAIFTPLTLSSLAMRLYVIFKVNRRNLQLDDILVVFSTASLLAFEGATFWAIHNGLGASSNALPWPQIAIQIKYIVSGYWSWSIATLLCKISFYYFYLKLFQCKPVYRVLLWTLIIVSAAGIPIFIAFFMTRCSPYWAIWDEELSKTNCESRTQVDLAAVVYNIFLDLAVFFVPLPIVWRPQMPTVKKVGVSIMFSLGFITIGVMKWRVVTTIRPHQSTDWLYGAALRTLQAHLELWLGLIAVNLPAGAPLFARISTFNISKNRKSVPVRCNATSNMVSLQTIGNVPSRKPAGRKGFQVLTDIETLDDTMKSVNKAQMISNSLQRREDESEAHPTPTGLV
ncbi:hypothetical protein GGR55DRAFT_293080 [Xylaria sp. FL0064]|nr:hypothetical protein GGR55DRAFT_293080 [Xylaria sp. FL0064]